MSKRASPRNATRPQDSFAPAGSRPSQISRSEQPEFGGRPEGRRCSAPRRATTASRPSSCTLEAFLGFGSRGLFPLGGPPGFPHHLPRTAQSFTATSRDSNFLTGLHAGEPVVVGRDFRHGLIICPFGKVRLSNLSCTALLLAVTHESRRSGRLQVGRIPYKIEEGARTLALYRHAAR